MKGYLLTSFRQKTLGIQLFKGFFSFRASISPSFLYIHNNTTSIHSRVYFDKKTHRPSTRTSNNTENRHTIKNSSSCPSYSLITETDWDLILRLGSVFKLMIIISFHLTHPFFHGLQSLFNVWFLTGSCFRNCPLCSSAQCRRHRCGVVSSRGLFAFSTQFF